MMASGGRGIIIEQHERGRSTERGVWVLVKLHDMEYQDRRKGRHSCSFATTLVK